MSTPERVGQLISFALEADKAVVNPFERDDEPLAPTPTHECVHGWVYGVDDQGREIVRPCLRCRLERRSRNRGGITENYEAATFASWRSVPALTKHVEAIKLWRGEPWAVAIVPGTDSNYGSGKTHVLSATVKLWIDEGLQAYYLPVSDLVDNEGRLVGGRGGEFAAAEWASEWSGLLALDDLGNEHEDRSGWAQSIVERVIDARYSHQRPTMIATNLPATRLAVRYPRTFSRLKAGKVIEWNASDYRAKR